MPATQENRQISISTPLGPDVLLLRDFRGNEGISTLFRFELELLSETHDIDFQQIIGEKVTVTVELSNGNKRYFNGIISMFSQLRSHAETGQDARYSRYTATMVPELWLLARTADLRIFQELSVPDIIEKIFQEKGITSYALRLTAPHDVRTYCVQYRETDFNFISRLMEEEGIYYFFEHEDGDHRLVLADSIGGHPSCPHQEEAAYHLISGGVSEEDIITVLEIAQEIRPGKYTLNDYNLEIPATSLKAEAIARTDLGPMEREIYDYPAEYDQRATGDRWVNIRMEEEEARITTFTGESDCRAFSSGFKFRLQGFYREDFNDKEYVLVTVDHEVSQPHFETSGASDVFSYRNSFTCIPHEVPFRPPRLTPKPIVEGVQTATVVGPSGEEIYTDKHGRVKVQFHWDREGNRDEKSSCWIWVSQIWAGTGWGAIFLPRIGQEVIVDYVEGDPDRPIITGRVYNGMNPHPYTLPDEKTKSAIKSYSSKGGEGFNEIRFEDKKGEEQLFFHAEKNHDVRVKNDSLEWVGNDRHLIVKQKRLELVESTQHLTIKGDSNQKVDGTKSVETGLDLHEKVGMNHAQDAGMDIHIKAGMNVVIEAGISVTLKTGSSFVVVGPSGVQISGPMVLINSGGAPGTGAGCSPATPALPQEADTAQPGQAVELLPGNPSSAQAQALTAAAKSGAPLCEL